MIWINLVSSIICFCLSHIRNVLYGYNMVLYTISFTYSVQLLFSAPVLAASSSPCLCVLLPQTFSFYPGDYAFFCLVGYIFPMKGTFQQHKMVKSAIELRRNCNNPIIPKIYVKWKQNSYILCISISMVGTYLN